MLREHTIKATDSEKQRWRPLIADKTMATKSRDSGEVIKNYHKQAFEYVSKALRIDEDDSGLFTVWQKDALLVMQLVLNTRSSPCC